MTPYMEARTRGDKRGMNYAASDAKTARTAQLKAELLAQAARLIKAAEGVG